MRNEANLLVLVVVPLAGGQAKPPWRWPSRVTVGPVPPAHGGAAEPPAGRRRVASPGPSPPTLPRVTSSW